MFYTKLLELIEAEHEPDNARRHESRKGVGAYTLCARCNNNTGSWYGPAYVDWAYQAMPYRVQMPVGSSLFLPFHIFPARIAKEVMAMFASACGPQLFAMVSLATGQCSPG